VKNIVKDNNAVKILWDKMQKFSLMRKEDSSKYLLTDRNIQVQFKKIKDEELKEETVFVLFTDISKIKKLEASKAETKYELLMTTVTHELRTPASSALSMLELLKTKNTDADEECREFIEIGINSCLLLLNLISDIMVTIVTSVI